MNRKIILHTISLCFFFCLFGSCTKKTAHVTISLSDQCAEKEKNTAYDVICKRIASLVKIKEVTPLINNTFDISYIQKKVEVPFEKLITQKGEIFVSECYDLDEMGDLLSEIYQNNPDKIYPPDTSILPMLATVVEKDTAFANEVFNQYKDHFSDDVSFLWAASPDPFYGDVCFLFAVKKRSAIFFNPLTVKKAKIDTPQYSPGFTLCVDLNEEYSVAFEKLTERNVSKPLPIVVDGKIISYPTVMEKISAGQLTIAGHFEEEELLLYQAFILGGALDCEGTFRSVVKN